MADVHGWDKSQRALQLVSYLDETAKNVAQELGDDELYDYDVLVFLRPGPGFMAGCGVIMKMPTSMRKLCCVGYPQSQ